MAIATIFWDDSGTSLSGSSKGLARKYRLTPEWASYSVSAAVAFKS